MYHTILDHILEKFQEYTKTTRAVILAPNSKYADALIAKLLHHPQYTALYYAISADDLELSTFIDNMSRAFVDRCETFGRYTSLAHLQWPNGLAAFREAILDGMIQDFNGMTGQRILLIVDDFDHAEQAEDIQRFLEELAIRLPEHCLLVFNGRTQPRFPWMSMIAQTRAIIFNDGDIVTQQLQPKTQDAFAELEIYAIGPGFVYVNGEHISQWEGHLPRLLLFFAVDRGVITRDDFHHAFWDSLDDVQATNVFHVTKRRLHRAVDLELLEHKNGLYHIRSGVSVYYDSFEWTQTLIAARDITNPNPAQAYQRLLEMYRGPFLKGHEDTWILARRQDILTGYIEAVLYLAARQIELFMSDSNRHYSAMENAHQLYLTALQEAPNHPELVIAAAELLMLPEVGRRIEAHTLLNGYLQAKKKAKESPDERILTLSKKLHNKKPVSA